MKVTAQGSQQALAMVNMNFVMHISTRLNYISPSNLRLLLLLLLLLLSLKLRKLSVVIALLSSEIKTSDYNC